MIKEKKKMEQIEGITEIVISLMRDKGLKFTMDDVAKQLHISKKTLYKVYDSKELLLYEIIKNGFDEVKVCEQEIADREELSLLEKIKKVIIVLPKSYERFDFAQFSQLKKQYPKLYAYVEHRIENGWELTLDLLSQAMEQRLIKNIQLPILKLMISGAMESFLTKDSLAKNKILYKDALQQMIQILMDGMVVESDRRQG